MLIKKPLFFGNLKLLNVIGTDKLPAGGDIIPWPSYTRFMGEVTSLSAIAIVGLISPPAHERIHPIEIFETYW
jgi:hypothetical protein